MKNLVIISIIILAGTVIAPYSSLAQQDDFGESKTLIFLQGEVMNPEYRDSYFEYKLFGKHYLASRAGGFGADYKRGDENDYWKFQGWGFVNFHEYNLSLGYAERSSGSEMVFVGVDHGYKDFLGAGFDLFFDIKNYFKLSGPRENYLDAYFAPAKQLGKWRVGANVIYNHYWTGVDRDWMLLGPTLQYSFTEWFSVRGRVARAWTWRDDRENYYVDQYRLDLKFSF